MRFTLPIKRSQQLKEKCAPKWYLSAAVLLTACSFLSGIVTPLAGQLGLPNIASLIFSLLQEDHPQRSDHDDSEESTGCPIVEPESKETVTKNEEESRDDAGENQSQKVFRQGNLLLKTHRARNGIDALSVYRGKRLILHTSIEDDRMGIAFPYGGESAIPHRVHTFDGGADDFISDAAKPASTPFTEFNGDGIPDLIVVQTGNGGNVYTIYSLGKRAKRLTSIVAVRSDADFMDIDHDGKCEAIARESAFFGWKTCNACSPVPQVILKLGRKRFNLATELMRTQPPTKERQEEILADWAQACNESPHDYYVDLQGKSDQHCFSLAPVVWHDLLDLIYSGNSKVAFRLLDKFWKKGTYAGNLGYEEKSGQVHTSKAQFISMFLEQLRHSQYLNGIKALNQGDPHIRNLGQSLYRNSEWPI